MKITTMMVFSGVVFSVFLGFGGRAIADQPVCVDADGNEIACENAPVSGIESADGTGGTESVIGAGGIESADGTGGTQSVSDPVSGIESADGTGGTQSVSDPVSGIESADGTGGTESVADPAGG